MTEGFYAWLENWADAFLTVLGIALALGVVTGIIYLGMAFADRCERRRRRRERMPIIYPPRKPNGPNQ